MSALIRVVLDEHQIRPVAGSVRESPRDVAVAAHDNGGHARQRHTGDLVSAGVGPRQRNAVPNVGHREVEVHVVRDDRAAARGVRARDRPVVAARHEVVRETWTITVGADPRLR